MARFASTVVRTPVRTHESFTKDFGTLATDAHARGEHEGAKRSLVCRECRTR